MKFSENDKKIPKITYMASRMGSHFCQAPNLQSELSEPFDRLLTELSFNMIEILLCLGFIPFMVLLCDIYARHFE